MSQHNPDLSSYDFIVVNSSAGKDSQTMLDYVVELADAAGVRDRLVVLHCDLGRVEWEGTKALAAEQASYYGLRFEVMRRAQGDLLTHVEQRGKWPSNTARYCTSDHKRAQGYRLLTKLTAEKWTRGRTVRILNCMGFRAQESPARRKREPFVYNAKASNGKRHVDEWLPIHTWTEDQVWDRIKKSGVRHHWAYDVGMPRLSCCFCIFAPRNALVIAGHYNPELLKEYVRVENKINHTFRQDVSLVQIQEAVNSGEKPAPTKEWGKMCVNHNEPSCHCGVCTVCRNRHRVARHAEREKLLREQLRDAGIIPRPTFRKCDCERPDCKTCKNRRNVYNFRMSLKRRGLKRRW